MYGKNAFMPMVKKSVMAGAFIALGAMFSMAVAQYGNLAQGICFSVGLFGVLCCNAKLFTGSILTVQSAWDNRTTYKELFASLASIWSFNLVGAVILALMASQTHFDASMIATAKSQLPCHELFIRSVLCNVMVCFAVWAYKKSACGKNRLVDVASACVLPVACFVACGFEHSIADMFYMSLGMMQGAVSPISFAYVICVATIGNVVGGVVFSWLAYDRSDS